MHPNDLSARKRRQQFSVTPASGVLGTILRKEDNAMTYSRPEVTLVGYASKVIESQSGKVNSSQDGAPPNAGIPAYDLDE